MAGISKKERIRRTAYHEAGHAIACFAIGHAFKDITIIPSEEYHGALKHRTWITFDPSLTSYGWEAKEIFRIKKEILICLGGPAAESILLERSARKNWSGGADHGTVFDLLDALYAGLGSDVEENKEVLTYIEYMELVVINNIRRNWKFVDRIAQALLAEKTLTYKRAKELVHRDGNLPWEEQKKLKPPIALRPLKYL